MTLVFSLSCYPPTNQNGGNADMRGITGGGSGGLRDRELVTETCTGMPWQSGVEVKQSVAQGTVLDIIQTQLNGNPTFRRNGGLLRWSTTYTDVIYIDSVGSRIVVASKCPILNLGMIRRLDQAVYDAALLIDKARPGTKNEEMQALYCGTRSYFAQAGLVYSRGIIAAWDWGKAVGTLSIPSMKPQNGAGIAACGFGVKNTTFGPLKINGSQVFDPHGIPFRDNGCSYFESYNPGSIGPGTYSFELSQSIGCPGCFQCRDGWASTSFWVEVAGENTTDLIGVSVKGAPQSVEAAKDFSLLKLPEPP